MNLFELPVRRPVATAMVFVGVVLLGLIAWNRITVELLPSISGDNLYLELLRPGSEPEVVERELLQPLEGRVSALEGVEETRGEIRGSGGLLQIQFAPGTNLKVRELELRQMAAEMVREQPPGTAVNVNNWDSTEMLRGFAMFIQVAGGDDRNALRNLIEQRISPRLSAVPEVARVVIAGGASRELTVSIDPDRCAAVGVTPDQVTAALSRAVGRLQFLGGLEEADRRVAVVLDGRPQGLTSLGRIRIVPDRAVMLRHVAEIDFDGGREEMVFRVNGGPSVGLIVYQEEGANLVRLGQALRVRIDELRDEFAPYGIDFVVSFDGAELIEDQLDRLKGLAVSGFVIALLVLFLFLRQWRGVAVVGIAVPVSLLAALALLFLSGQSINLITLFGLAVGIGMLVDNSIVVYEAVQLQLERGASPDAAATEGVRRTVRAILASSITNGVVFLPIVFLQDESSLVRSTLTVVALAYLLPLVGSLLVAVGLVPLLARHLAAPAAVRRLAAMRERRRSQAGLTPPDRARALFGGLLTVALRRPGAWVGSIIVAVLLTLIIALPWVAINELGQETREADQLQLAVELPTGGSLERAVDSFGRLEQAVLELDGVESVESFVREEGGSLTVTLVDAESRPPELTAASLRREVRKAADELDDVEISSPTGGGGGGGGGVAGLLGATDTEVVVSGPEAHRLQLIASELQARLDSLPEIANARVSSRTGMDEMHLVAREDTLAAMGLTADQVLPVLRLVRREGVEMRVGFTLPDGQEIPLTVRRVESDADGGVALQRMRVATLAGVVPLNSIADLRRMPPPPTIQHRDGRRELSVLYSLSDTAPQSGPARQALERQISEQLQAVNRPAGYTVETPEAEASTRWFKKVVLPVLLLLLAVLAITFESVTLPILVLLALPLTILGATWALVLTNMSPGLLGMVGALALIGLTVNPAILLVDRMQQRTRGGLSAGAAALAAVRERTRPVLMTTTTTVAALWPLALVTGRQNELWPPFATVVIGGLIASTLLTLLVVPVGFVFLRRLDLLFGRLGPWLLLLWLGSTTAVIYPLISRDLVSTTRWQIVTTLLVAALALLAIVLVVRRKDTAAPMSDDGPPVLEVRSLRKVYGRPGPVRRAWRSPQRFADWVQRKGGSAFNPRDARERIPPLLVTLFGAGYLANSLQSAGWRLVFLFVSTAILARMLREVRRARGRADELGRVEPGGVEGLVAVAAPWAAWVYAVLDMHVLARLAGERTAVPLWILVAVGLVIFVAQRGRATALALARGQLPQRPESGRLIRARTMWRGVSRKLFGLDLPREEIVALRGVDFRVEGGMVGVLGPNGAGKTTLLRQLAGILEPSLGTITLGGIRLERIRRFLGRWVGYLPQEFGLPDDLTAREYLEYYALLYEIPMSEQRQRVSRLLEEVGLAAKADQRIGSYSGGMRQRVAVARTLLRLPQLIIVDEPTVGLDPRERIRFRNLLSRLAEGRIVLFSTHVVEDVAVACDRVIVLAAGRLVFDGPPEELAQAARGRVWEVRLAGAELGQVDPAAQVVDQAPEADGRWRLRVIHAGSPHADATNIEPSLEDGYFTLVGWPEEAPA